MSQDEALACHKHQASCLGGQDDKSTLQELQQNSKLFAIKVQYSRANIVTDIH